MSRNADQLYEVLRLIRPVHQHAAAAVSSALASSDVSMPMRAVLEQLYESGPLTAPQIARSLWITRQGVQRFVDEARTLGYVESQTNPGHKRSHLITLTKQGKTAYKALHGRELLRLKPIAKALDPEDVAACLRVLSHLNNELAAIDEDTP